MAVGPSEATHVARGTGESHENASISHQPRFDDGQEERSNATDQQHRISKDSFIICVAPPLEREGEARKLRPPLEILSTLSHLPRGAREGTGGTASSTESIPNRPEHDSQIVALKQGRIMCTSFHPELTADRRMHELFVRKCVLSSSLPSLPAK